MFCAPVCVLRHGVLARNVTKGIDEWEKKNITEGDVLQDDLLVLQESTTDFGGKHTNSYPSVENNDHDKSYSVDTHMNLLTNTSSSPNALTSVNTFNDQATGFHSVYLDLDLKECAMKWPTYHVRGTEGSILFSLTPGDNSHEVWGVLTCTVELEVPQGMFVHVRTLNKLDVFHYRVLLTDNENATIFNNYIILLPEEFFIYSRIVKFQLITSAVTSAFQLYVNFTAIPEASSPQLITTFLSPTAGILFMLHFYLLFFHNVYIDISFFTRNTTFLE